MCSHSPLSSGERSGLAALGALGHYIVTVSMVGIVIGAFAYPVAVFAGKVKFTDYARQIAPVQAFAVSTQSSLASLPLMLKKAEALGVRESTAGLVLPMAVALAPRHRARDEPCRRTLCRQLVRHAA